jgi:hypothetical protein
LTYDSRSAIFVREDQVIQVIQWAANLPRLRVGGERCREQGAPLGDLVAALGIHSIT